MEKIGKLSQTKLFLRPFSTINHNIIIVQVRYITIETKEVVRIGYTAFPFLYFIREGLTSVIMVSGYI